MRIGVVGTGTMGTLITEALIKSRTVKPRQIFITNRTKAKAERLQEKHPGIHVCESAVWVVGHAEIVFLCIRPAQFFPLLQSVRGNWRLNQTAVSITSPIPVAQLEQLIPCPVVRAVPSILNRSLSGNMLVTFGTGLSDYQKFKIWNLLGNFSHPIEISEKEIRPASDISSCGPAFLSFILQKMIQAASAVTPLSAKEAGLLTAEMLIGLGKLLEDGELTLSDISEKTVIKGGVTGIGLHVLNEDYAGSFERLFQETRKKYEEDRQAIDRQFNQKE